MFFSPPPPPPLLPPAHPCSSQLAGPIRDSFVGSRHPLIGTDAAGLHGDTLARSLTDYSHTAAAERLLPRLWSPPQCREQLVHVANLTFFFFFNEADAAAEVKRSRGDVFIYISAYLSISQSSHGRQCSALRWIIEWRPYQSFIFTNKSHFLLFF